MIKLFASDLDGTLLGASHLVTEPVRRAVRAAVASGAYFSVATGRTFRTGGDFGFAGLGTDAVAANGSIVLTRDDELIRFETIDPAVVEELVRAFPEAPFACIGRKHTYVLATKAEFDAGFSERGVAKRVLMAVRMSAMRRSGTGFKDEQVYESELADVMADDICKVNLHCNDAAMVREIERFLADHTESLVNAPFNPTMFELTRTGVSKATGVGALAEHYGIAEDEVAVYGDGGNDILMLKRYAPYGHAYTPRGGCDDAREAASEVIGSNVLHAVPRHIQMTVKSQAEV